MHRPAPRRDRCRPAHRERIACGADAGDRRALPLPLGLDTGVLLAGRGDFGGELLAALVTPIDMIVQQSFDTGQRVIGLLFDCAWEPSLGLAVKFVNEKIDAVGTQDIVL